MSKFQNYIPQPFAFYRELSAGDRRYQNYNLNQCKSDLTTWRFTVISNLASPLMHIPRFDLKTDYEPTAINSFRLKSKDGAHDIPLNDTNFNFYPLKDDNSLWAIIYNATPIPPGAMDPIPIGKQWELTVDDGTNVWYSEVFEFVEEDPANSTFPAPCGTEGWLSLEWSNPGCIISETFYHDSAGVMQLLLPLDLAQPNYEYKTDEENDGDGGQTKTFERLDKVWSFFIVAPEYIADALSAAQMFSNVSITFPGGDSIQCHNFKADVNWQTDCLAKITCTFTAEFLAKTACCGA